MRRESWLWVVVAVCILAFAMPSFGGTSIALEREKMLSVLDSVTSEIEHSFYDPNLKGLDWKQMKADARAKIMAANDAGPMLAAISRLVEALNDSHTVFIPPALTVESIFGFEAKAYEDVIRVHKIAKGGAAEKAGLKLGDEIVEVNGVTAQRKNFEYMMAYFHFIRPVSKLVIVYRRGKEGSPQTLSFEPKFKKYLAISPSWNINDVYDLINEAENNPVKHEYATWAGDIGYIKLANFSFEKTDLLFDKIKNSRATVLDLRGNRGGTVDVLRQVSGYFYQEAVPIADEVRRSKTETMKVKPQHLHLSGPLVVLIDSESASASEAFARLVQRTGRGTVIGDRSAGALTSAQVFVKEQGAVAVMAFAIEVAVGRVIFPGGEEIEGVGVKPDRQCTPTGEDLAAQNDPCLRLATELARQKLAEMPKGTAAGAN